MPKPFVVWSDAPAFVVPNIVVQYNPANGTGADWSALLKMPEASYVYDAGKLRDAVQFLQDAVKKMTGRTLPVRSSADLSHGIVFTTLAGATPDIKNDPKVRKALADDGSGAYNANEAYYIRTEADRTVLVANTNDGLVDAAADLAESAGYVVLGMGPNWVDAPDHSRSLVFDTEHGGRPGYYLRRLWPTSGQSYGVGTIYNRSLSDPADETVDRSYQRWRVGARLTSQSMPVFTGHSLQAYHHAVARHIRDTGDTAGFLAPTDLGLDAQRLVTPPSTVPAHLWINSDAPDAPEAGKVYFSNGTTWVEQSAHEKVGFAAVLDVSVRAVRSIVLAGVEEMTEVAFKTEPDKITPMAIEPEDGGASDAAFVKYRKNPNWYPEYLKENGLPFGAPYALNGSYGLDQPNEQWDPASQSDAMYAFALWIQREYDRWIDTLPAEQQVTSSGASKKSLARATFYSYNYHDVPPGFNLGDPRLRVMVAGFAKHRGLGKWKAFRTRLDVAKALHVWLPEPLADYGILSNAYYNDWAMSGLPALADFSPTAISDHYSTHHDAGVRAQVIETDFNFGKFGLGYYLTATKLWNPAMSARQLDAIRDQWLQRSFGNAWRTMKQYYDFLLAPNYPVNSTSSWGHAIQLITDADDQIPATEPAVKRRIDDLKQYWYYYFLYDTGKLNDTAPETREFVWKGQMAYMNAMYALMRHVYGSTDPAAVAGPATSSGPAHYTAAETASWWQQVRAHWPEVNVDRFDDATLADGTLAKDIDQNDLTLVREFVWPGSYGQFFYNAGYQTPAAFLTHANQPGQTIGFNLWWPKADESPYAPRDVYYGVEWWNPRRHRWEAVLDKSTTAKPSVDMSTYRLVRAAMSAPKAGIFRFSIGYAGNLARLAPLTYDIDASSSTGRSPHTYFKLASGLTQSPVYSYIPKGTHSLDLDVWDQSGNKKLRIYSALLSKNPSAPYRDVDISAMKTHRIPLQPGEDGTIVRISGGTFGFPYLHSMPRLWAMSPAELMVPRAIAAADGLTVPLPPGVDGFAPGEEALAVRPGDLVPDGEVDGYLEAMHGGGAKMSPGTKVG
ncbi:hypothetical protein [Streptomyces sp. NPDC046712]|uniref:hypothetical protein n=1 Tax=Streptomyces sp. NPDC046712 TaxID=3154802 RepID=UPI0033CF0C8F